MPLPVDVGLKPRNCRSGLRAASSSASGTATSPGSSAGLMRSMSRSCSVTAMPRSAHQAAMSPPMTPAPITWTRRNTGFSLPRRPCFLSPSERKNTRRRLRRRVRRHQRHEAVDLGGASSPASRRHASRTGRSAHRAPDSARGAPSCAPRRASCRRRSCGADPSAITRLANGAGVLLRFCSTALRAFPAQLVAVAHQLVDEAHAARLPGRAASAPVSIDLHRIDRRRPAGSSGRCRRSPGRCRG